MFDKRESLFPIKRRYLYLSHSSIGPLYAPAAQAAEEFLDAHAEHGRGLIERYEGVLTSFRERLGNFLQTSPENVAYVSHTAEGINLIANGYPFRPGDQIVSYTHEYPSNHYPWALQRRRGVELVLLGDADPAGAPATDGPRGWSMPELEARVTPRTRVVALSHVQFASGFAADLAALGAFCRDRGIDLVIDAAQSLGVLPLHPEEHGIAAIAASAWKWLLGPRGGGLMYTSPALRAKLEHTMVGAGTMKHRFEYLNHAWDPIEDARRFEYSTLPWEHLVAIDKVLEEVFLRYPIEAIRDEVLDLQDCMLERLDERWLEPLLFPRIHRSGILAVRPKVDALALIEALAREGIILTAPGGHVRLAPHFYLSREEVNRAALAINAACARLG